MYNEHRNKKAILFLKEGNAVTDESLQVSIVDEDYKIGESELGNIFIADSNHDLALLESSSISLKWIANDTLQIIYNNKLRTFSKLTSLNEVRIVYEEIGDKPEPLSTSINPKFKIDKGSLKKGTIELKVDYGGIACSCAQWIETKALADSLGERQYFYLEKGREGILDADTIFNGSNLPVDLLLKGQFYSKIGYPENYNPGKGEPPPARVFRYSLIKILH